MGLPRRCYICKGDLDIISHLLFLIAWLLCGSLCLPIWHGFCYDFCCKGGASKPDNLFRVNNLWRVLNFNMMSKETCGEVVDILPHRLMWVFLNIFVGWLARRLSWLHSSLYVALLLSKHFLGDCCFPLISVSFSCVIFLLNSYGYMVFPSFLLSRYAASSKGNKYMTQVRRGYDSKTI